MASDSKNVCRTASQCCDGWLDERIVGAVLEGGSQKSFLLCLSIYKVIRSISAKRERPPSTRRHTQELYDTTEKQLFLFFSPMHIQYRLS